MIKMPLRIIKSGQDNHSKLISSNIVLCDTFFKKATGLMFKSRTAVNDAAWVFIIDEYIPRRVSITMSFVFFPIDVVFLDAKKRVIGLKKCLKPWQLYTPKDKCCFFIELANGMISSKNIAINDILVFSISSRDKRNIYK
jgi:uncharacterized membrane protein (UPF0127 family)